MYCAIRQYEGCTDVEKLQKRVEGELLPTLRDMAGFQSYLLVDCDDGDVTSISVFETQEQAEAANQQVAEIAKSSFADLLPESPMISVGEVLADSRK